MIFLCIGMRWVQKSILKKSQKISKGGAPASKIWFLGEKSAIFKNFEKILPMQIFWRQWFLFMFWHALNLKNDVKKFSKNFWRGDSGFQNSIFGWKIGNFQKFWKNTSDANSLKAMIFIHVLPCAESEN